MTTLTTAPAVTVGDALDCGHILTAAMQHEHGTHSTGVPLTTGYARTQDGRTLCYADADAAQRADFADAQTFAGYVSAAGDLTTWTGGVLATAQRGTHGVSRAGWHGAEVHAWRFTGPDGSSWYGRNGGPGMFITARRAKH